MNADTILNTLAGLDEALNVMEKSVTSLERLAFAPQRDLFGGWISGDASAVQDAPPAIDTALLNKKLDAAIGRVQQILQEAA